jgi:predicted acetyltransferase
MKKYRRKGLGKAVANIIFDTFPGNWEVCQYLENITSQIFWERVISDYTNNKFKKYSTLNEKRVGISFDNSKEN